MTLQFLRSEPGAEPVVSSAEFVASPARVYKAWTESDEIRSWFGRAPNSVRTALIDLRVGGVWRFAFNDTPGSINALHGEYLEIVPKERLVFTWIHERAKPDGVLEETTPSQVTVLFEPFGTGTRLTVRHEGIRQESGRIGVADGWDYGLAGLSAMLKRECAGKPEVSS